ncbi:MAG TPA: efflux RND transporter periplasmic adaptor subunit, partial [Nannocystis sp.]
QAQSDVKRAQDLGNAATGEELEQARTRLAEARAQRSLASRQLGDTTVRAPFAGSISARHVAPGTYVKPGSLLFDLVAVDKLRLTLEVPERYAALVNPGTAVTIGARDRVETGPPEQTDIGPRPGADRVDATVTRVSPVVSPTTRTFTVEAVFSPAGSVLRPGMFIAATLALGTETAGVRVPRSAVFHVLGRDRVMIVVDGVARPQDIEMVGEDGGEAIVLGLEPGVQVIARSPAQVAPGTPVTPEPISTDAAAVTPAGAPATGAGRSGP